MEPTISLKTQKGVKHLYLKGELDIRYIAKIYNKVMELTKAREGVKIHLHEVKNIDLSFLQIMGALIAHLKKEGIGFSIEAELPANEYDLIINTGFQLLLSESSGN